jgi:outer membrane protein assembly factor BamB
MTRIILPIAILALGAGCPGSGGSHASCSGADSCTKGNYCARTPDGSVCWPDDVKPVVSAIDASCAPLSGVAPDRCLRSGVVHVAVSVTEDHGVTSVTASLVEDPAHAVPLTATANGYEGDLRLEDSPFPHFEGDVTVAVTATDAAQNASDPVTKAISVTRRKWERQLEPASVLGPSSPAVLKNGTIVLAGNSGKLFFVNLNGTASRDPVPVSAASGPPAVGGSAVWLASVDGHVYSFGLDGEAISLPSNCATTQALVGPLAVSGVRAFVGSSEGVFLAANGSAPCSRLAIASAITSPPVITSDGRLIAGTAGELHRFSMTLAGDLVQDWVGSPAAPIVGVVSAPLAIDDGDSVWSIAANAELFRTSAGASASRVTTLDGAVTGPIVLSGGIILTSSPNQVLQATLPGGVPPWARSATLNGVPSTPLVLDSGDLVVPTSTGRVCCVEVSTGLVQWSAKLVETGVALQPANIWTEPGAKTSTAYLAGADGKLYAVIVDGALDKTAPWPKAYHDPQNTSNAGSPL